MKTWQRKGYSVVEREFNYDLHEFDIVVGNAVIATITPDNLEDMNDIVEQLDNGADPVAEAWEDGMGNIITLEIDVNVDGGN